jgi:hypothetical protein
MGIRAGPYGTDHQPRTADTSRREAMLTQTIEVDQTVWTQSSPTTDVQMDEGICLALVHEWCTKNALRNYAQLNLFFSRSMPNMHRLFSFQRGFNLVSDSINVGANYANFYQSDEGLTAKMIINDGLRSQVYVVRELHTANIAVAANYLNHMYRGDTFMIGYWGVDDDGDNWGHVVGVAWNASKAHPHYFDPNQGLFRGSGVATFGTDVIQDIEDYWDDEDINDLVIYRYRRI